MKAYTIGLYEKAMPNTLTWKEKLEAAKEAGAILVAVARPGEDGESLESVERLMKESAEKHC